MSRAAESFAPRRSLLSAEPGRRETLVLAGALALLSCLPFLVAAYPQMTDYPSHLARWHVMLDQGHSAWLSRYYSFEWHWNGNLGADLLIWPFARVFGLELGGRMVGAIVPVLTGLGLICVEWTLRRRIGVGALLAFATIWSPMFNMGLLNFGLALALALFGFALWVRLDGWRWRWAVFVPLAFAVWLCHVAGWGVLGLLVLCHELHRRFALGALLAPWPLAFPLLAQLQTSGATGSAPWGTNVLRYKWAMWNQALRDQSHSLDTYSLLFLILAIVAAAVLRKLDRRLGWAALLFAILTLAMPRHFGGGDYADMRLVPVALMIGCLAIDWHPPRWALYLAPLLFLVRLGVTTEAWRENARKAGAVLAVLDHVPQGARIAAAAAVDGSRWPLDRQEHIASYATIRRDALVNTHFAIPGVHMLRLREASPGFADPSHRIFVSPGERLDLSAFAPAREADYLWYTGDLPPARLPVGAVTIYRAKGTLLARLAKPPVAR